ncbi:PAS domain-containing protein [Neorickettsia risticii]
METLAARRKGDLVVSIVHGNDNDTALVSGANDAMLSLLSYEYSELEGKPFLDILEDADRRKIVEHLEYEDYSIDIGTVLARTRQIHFKTKYGVAIRLKIKIFPSSSTSSREKRYEILGREHSCLDHLAEFRRVRHHYEYSIDEVLRIMDPRSTGEEFVLLSHFCQQYQENCVAGLLQLSNTSVTMMRGVIDILRGTMRHGDQIGIVGKVLVIFIVGCSPEFADRPMSRIAERIKRIDNSATLRYFNLLEHPVFDFKTDLLQQKRIFARVVQPSQY